MWAIPAVAAHADKRAHPGTRGAVKTRMAAPVGRLDLGHPRCLWGCARLSEGPLSRRFPVVPPVVCQGMHGRHGVGSFTYPIDDIGIKLYAFVRYLAAEFQLLRLDC